MSVSARFWTLDASHRGDIVKGFEPFERVQKGRFLALFSKTAKETVYPWSSYLEAVAHEEAQYPSDGYAFVELDLMLPEDAKPFALGLTESDALCRHTQASASLLDVEAARQIRANISAKPLSQSDILRFFEANSRPLSDPTEATYVLDAQRQLCAWLQRVTPGRMGLLLVA
jgi:hypothetical protein